MKFQQFFENEEAKKVSSIPMYRGARDGNPTVLNGPSYFISNEMFAKTYGPVAAFELNIKNPKIVSDSEWHEFDSIAGNPEAITDLQSQGYDSAINIRQTPIGPLYIVILIDPKNAKLIS